MNITPQAPNLSTPTVLNQHTESLRRDNSQREVISQPAALNHSGAEKGVASDKERGRTPAQNNANIDFASLKEQAELANNEIKDQSQQQNSGQGNQQSSDDDVQQEKPTNATSSEEEVKQKSREQAAEVQQAREITQLKRRDQEVRSHELAHASVGGAYTGAPNYSFETGPDGKKYAVEGEVSADLSVVEGDPRATIAKMQKVHAAALAPANPSVQDTRVAATAAQIILQAQSQLLSAEGNEFARENSGNTGYVNPNSTLAEDADSSGKGARDSSDKGSQDFDTFINQTLKAQEQVVPTRSEDVTQRASRIEQFYSDITQAYEKPASYQFELTA